MLARSLQTNGKYFFFLLKKNSSLVQLILYLILFLYKHTVLLKCCLKFNKASL